MSDMTDLPGGKQLRGIVAVLGLGLLVLGHSLVMVRLLLLGYLLSHHALVNGGDALGKVGKSDPVGLGELGSRHRPEKLQLADQLIADEGIIVRHFVLDFLVVYDRTIVSRPRHIQFF